MQFQTLNEQARAEIDRILARTEYNGCDYQQSYQYAWFSKNIEYCETQGIYFIRFHCVFSVAEDHYCMLPPVTEPERLAEAYALWRDKFCHGNRKPPIVQAPREHAALLDPEQFVCENDPDAAEYLYDSKDLIELKGKKYHAKRNHIAKFRARYEFTFREYAQTDYEEVLKLLNLWQERKGNDLGREETAILRLLERVEEFGLFGAVIECENKIIAFSLGEITGTGVGIVHFEKADTSYEGVYAAINQMFAEKYFKNVRIINRQEDMGIEGLRKAKLSYYPVGMSEKWIIKSI